MRPLLVVNPDEVLEAILLLLDGDIPDYDDFLEERRKLMALKIRTWFEAL